MLAPVPYFLSPTDPSSFVGQRVLNDETKFVGQRVRTDEAGLAQKVPTPAT